MKKQADGFEEMTNLSKSLREKLEETCEYTCLENVQTLVSELDGTRKYLFRLSDGYVVESVLMRYQHGNSVCISTQVGCRMGCRFCASTIGGKTRDLTAGEMLDQIYRIQKDIGERVSNLVMMGTGEPLDNYDNAVKFIRMLSDEHGLNISQRNITLSTCGIVPRMRQLADEGFQITLALSLHAPNQEKIEKHCFRSPENMRSMRRWMPAGIIMKRPDVASRLSTALLADRMIQRRCKAALRTDPWHQLPCESDSGQSGKRTFLCAVGTKSDCGVQKVNLKLRNKCYY